jgi:hypothetical protein
MAVDQALAVKVDEHVESRVQDIAHFFGGKRALRQNLAEVFLGKFQDRINELQVIQAAVADIENGKQVGMVEMSGALPQAELHFGSGRPGSNQFEHRFLARGIREFCQKNGAEFRAGETLTQDEFAVDRLAFPSFPLLGHNAPHAK